MKRNSYIGKRYGKLTVVEGAKHFTTETNRRELRQRCRCDCGTIVYVRTNALTSGNTNSCGCGSSLVGTTIGKLSVIQRNGKIATNGTEGYACVCLCGNIVDREHGNLQQALKNGVEASCGCYNKEQLSDIATTHGLSRVEGKKTKLFRAWDAMRQRCYNKNHASYSDYGGRGITVCNDWIEDFKCFYEWSYANGFVDGKKLSIDRVDNNRGYYPDNCRWVTSKEQQRNRRTTTYLEYNGERKPLTRWAEELGLKPTTIRSRLRKGLSVEEALSTTMNYRNRKKGD